MGAEQWLCYSMIPGDQGLRTGLHVTMEVAMLVHVREAGQDLEGHVPQARLSQWPPPLLHQLVQIALLWQADRKWAFMARQLIDWDSAAFPACKPARVRRPVLLELRKVVREWSGTFYQRNSLLASMQLTAQDDLSHDHAA